MDAEEFTVFFGNKGMSAVRACETDRFCYPLRGNESLTTDFALVLPVAAVIVIDVVVRSTAYRAHGIFRDGPAMRRCTGLTFFLYFQK